MPPHCVMCVYAATITSLPILTRAPQRGFVKVLVYDKESFEGQDMKSTSAQLVLEVLVYDSLLATLDPRHRVSNCCKRICDR